MFVVIINFIYAPDLTGFVFLIVFQSGRYDFVAVTNEYVTSGNKLRKLYFFFQKSNQFIYFICLFDFVIPYGSAA